jgi:hypothetical protein
MDENDFRSSDPWRELLRTTYEPCVFLRLYLLQITSGGNKRDLNYIHYTLYGALLALLCYPFYSGRNRRGFPAKILPLL